MRDVIIIGGGSAGLTAGLYAARAGLDALLIERGDMRGGQAALAGAIHNYPGFPNGIFGDELMEAFEAQARGAGLSLDKGEFSGFEAVGGAKRIALSGGRELDAKCLILAMGARPRTLGVAGEAELFGRGVSYCATCDGPLYRGKRVAVVGGGDTAVEDALFLAQGSEVTLIHRRDALRARGASVAELASAKNITLRMKTVVDSISETGSGIALNLRASDGSRSILEADGLFVAIGTVPVTGSLVGRVELDGGGYVVAGEDTATSVPGVFAAGDIRAKPLRQIVTAASDGAVAAHRAGLFVLGMGE